MNHYECLGISDKATPEEIRKAYRKAAARNHPDRGGQATEFHKIQLAYEVLSQPTKKAQYDQNIWAAAHSKPQQPSAHGNASSKSKTANPGGAENFSNIFDEFLRDHGPQQQPPAANPAEEQLRQEFIKTCNRAPHQRPSWLKNVQDFGPAPTDPIQFQSWARESNEYWEWYHQQESKVAAEDAEYDRKVQFVNMNPHEQTMFLNREQKLKEQDKQAKAAATARQTTEKPYWDARRKLPDRFAARLPQSNRPGVPLKSVQGWRVADRITLIVPILAAIAILIASTVSSSANPALAVVLGIIELVLLAPAVWIGWVILNSIITYAFKSTPGDTTLEQDIKNYIDAINMTAMSTKSPYSNPNAKTQPRKARATKN